MQAARALRSGRHEMHPDFRFGDEREKGGETVGKQARA